MKRKKQFSYYHDGRSPGRDCSWIRPSAIPCRRMLYHMAETRLAVDARSGAKRCDLKDDDAKRYAELKKQLAAFDSMKPAPLPEGQFMIDI